jgi:hypothetical protein
LVDRRRLFRGDALLGRFARKSPDGNRRCIAGNDIPLWLPDADQGGIAIVFLGVAVWVDIVPELSTWPLSGEVGHHRIANGPELALLLGREMIRRRTATAVLVAGIVPGFTAALSDRNDRIRALTFPCSERLALAEQNGECFDFTLTFLSRD